LLELSQVEITQVAQIAKAHCLVPPISLSINVKSVLTHIALSAKPTPPPSERPLRACQRPRTRMFDLRVICLHIRQSQAM
jgi:hypothetical protein